MAPKRKSPYVRIERHEGKQHLVVKGKIKLVVDKILRYALFDGGTRIAVLFKDENNSNHLTGINLRIFYLDINEFDTILLDPQPASESKEDVFFIGEKRNKKITVCFKAGPREIYYLRSDSLEKRGPFTEIIPHPDLVR